MHKRGLYRFLIPAFFLSCGGCMVVTVPYTVAKAAVTGSVWVVKSTYEVIAGTAKVIYRIGEFTYEVVKAPSNATLTHEEIESIDGLPVKEAIRRGRVTTAPYVVRGHTYYPLSVEKAQGYREEGIASRSGAVSGRMTATGEVFTPNGLTAAHKYLPIPMFVRVTNLDKQKSIAVRVNDRGPFPSEQNPKAGDLIIELSPGAATQLGFSDKGTANVRVEALLVKEE